MWSSNLIHKDTADFYESIERWIQRLYDLVEELKRRNKEVLIVAVARKMPRLMQVLLKSPRLQYEKRRLLKRIVADSDFVTEHALPFVYTNRPRSSYETVLIDDTAVFGNTLRNVAEDIKLFSGKRPFALPIFVSDRVYFGDALSRRMDIPWNVISSCEIQSYHSKVAELIERNALPIDVEFPVLRCEEVSVYEANSLFENLNRIFTLSNNSSIEFRSEVITPKEKTGYFGGIEEVERSFSLSLHKEMSWRVMTSFSKLRFFQQNEKVCVGVFSPQTLPDNRLAKRNLFENRCFNRVWEEILSHIQEGMLDFRWNGIPERVGRSLVVWTNYLLSLSRYNSFAKDYPYHLSDLTIESKDINLLAGKRLTNKLMEMLPDIVAGKEVTRPIYGKESLPNIIAPRSLKGPYQSIRTECWVMGLGDGIEGTLDRLFATMDYTQGSLAKTLTSTERLYAGVYETQESLVNLLNMRPFDEDVEHELSEWIDRNIDAGRLVPSYQPVESDYGERWWQRCFSSSKSCVEL